MSMLPQGAKRKQMLVAASVAKNDFCSFALDKVRATLPSFARNQRLTNSDHRLGASLGHGQC